MYRNRTPEKEPPEEHPYEYVLCTAVPVTPAGRIRREAAAPGGAALPPLLHGGKARIPYSSAASAACGRKPVLPAVSAADRTAADIPVRKLPEGRPESGRSPEHRHPQSDRHAEQDSAAGSEAGLHGLHR